MSHRVSARLVILFLLFGIFLPVSCTAISGHLQARRLDSEFAMAAAHRALEILLVLQDDYHRESGTYANNSARWVDSWLATAVPSILASTSEGYVATATDEGVG